LGNVESGESSKYQLNLTSGSTNVVAAFPFSWVGDDVYTPPRGSTIVIGAISNAVTGNYDGGVTVVDNDPPPTLSVAKKTVRAAEGQSLKWTFELSVPTSEVEIYCYTTAPSSGRKELKSNDVPRAWLLEVSQDGVPAKPTPLSDLLVYITVRFGPGATTASLDVPIARDNVAEGVEWVSFQCVLININGDTQYLQLDGRVLAGRRQN
jgi:hypothetical protein